MDTAQELAEALGSGRLPSAVRTAGEDGSAAPGDVGTVLEGMNSSPYSIAVREVVKDPEDDDSAVATLGWEWELTDTETWSYDTTVPLSLGDDGWDIGWSPAAVQPTLKPGERLVLREDRSGMERGEILGADGVTLVGRQPVYRLGIDKTLVDASAARSSAVSLANLLELEEVTAYADRVEGAGSKAFVEALVVRTDGSYPLDLNAVASIPGAVALDSHMYLPPSREFARPILGTVGAATAELIQESEGRLIEGDITGLSGLQRVYDERLRGDPGIIVEAQSANGARELYRVEPAPGSDLRTTLNVSFQLAAEEILADVEPASSIVAIRPSDGHVLAAASGPGGNGLSTATTGRYAPGSTFKVITSLALLRAGLTADSPVECPETIEVVGREFKNHSGYPSAKLGTLSLREAIANSCNTAVIGQHAAVSQADVADAAKALGLGQASGLGIPAFEGSVPTDGGEVEHAAAMIGQGRAEVSPLVLANLAASVAAGDAVVPKFVLDEIEMGSEPAPASHPVTAEEAAQLQALMRAVVTEGTATFLGDIPGPAIGAETGTAEFGTEDPPLTHAWMIAIRGDLAVAVFVEEGDSGSGTAGPLLEEFLRVVPPT